MSTMDVIRAALFTPLRDGYWGQNILVTGKPGAAKSGKINTLGKHCGMPVETLMINLLEAPEFQGYPVVVEKVTERRIKNRKTGDVRVERNVDREMEYAPPAWAKRARRAGRSIVFLDELNTASPPVMAAAMNLVLNRRAGSFDLGEGVRFIGAMNSAEVAAGAGGVEIPPALANRFGHLDMELPTHAEWSDWISTQELAGDSSDIADPEAIENDVMSKWADAYKEASGEVLGFLAAVPKNRLAMPSLGDEKIHSAWASLRTWEMAIRARASAKIHKLDEDDSMKYQAAFIGLGPLTEFTTWVRNADLPNIAEFLEGQATFQHVATRADRSHAFLLGCALHISSLEGGKRKRELTNFFKAAAAIAKENRDILVTVGANMKSVKSAEIMKLDDEHIALYTSLYEHSRASR